MLLLHTLLWVLVALVVRQVQLTGRLVPKEGVAGPWIPVEASNLLDPSRFGSPALPSICPEVRTGNLSKRLPDDLSSSSFSSSSSSRSPNRDVVNRTDLWSVDPGRMKRSASAVCELIHTDLSHHFPHTMEQLYRCWSWWQHYHHHQQQQQNHSNDSPSQLRTTFLQKKPPTFILLIPYPMSRLPVWRRSNRAGDVVRWIQRKRWDFLTGFTHALRRQFAVSIVLQSRDDDHHLNNSHPHTNQQHQYDRYAAIAVRPIVNGQYALHSPQDARALTDGLWQYVVSRWQRRDRAGCPVLSSRSSSRSANSSDSSRQPYRQVLPRIGILNRANYSHRTLLNVQKMAEQLAHTLEMMVVTTTSPATPRRPDPGPEIAVAYFEKWSFAEQVRFMGSVDLLISPHGAQLTGLPFLPPCGAVLELFPVGYYRPEYFGSLAAAAGMAHYALYVSPTDWQVDNAEGLKDGATRARMRSADLCPALQDVVAAVQDMVHDWQSCCSHQKPSVG